MLIGFCGPHYQLQPAPWRSVPGCMSTPRAEWPFNNSGGRGVVYLNRGHFDGSLVTHLTMYCKLNASLKVGVGLGNCSLSYFIPVSQTRAQQTAIAVSRCPSSEIPQDPQPEPLKPDAAPSDVVTEAELSAIQCPECRKATAIPVGGCVGFPYVCCILLRAAPP